jgi:hypothetical protein
MKPKKNRTASKKCLLTTKELAFLAGTSPRIVERLLSFEVLCPECAKPEPAFKPETLGHVKKAIRIHEQFGVAWSSVGFVMDLIRRIEVLESGSDGNSSSDEEA